MIGQGDDNPWDNALVEVTGDGTQLNVEGATYVGVNSGHAELRIQQAATASLGDVNVAGTNSGSASMIVRTGANVTANDLFLADSGNKTATLTVAGSDTQLNINDALSYRTRRQRRSMFLTAQT